MAHRKTILLLLALAASGFVAGGCASGPRQCACSEVSREAADRAPGSPQRPGAPHSSGFSFSLFLDPCACSRELSDGGRGVLLLSANQVGSDCQVLSQLRTGFYEPVRYDVAGIMLRNLAAEAGANAVSIDIFEPGSAQGRALQCTTEFLSERRPAAVEQAADLPEWTTEAGVTRNRQRRIGWQQCSTGQQEVQGRCQGAAIPMKWPDAADYCRRLSLGNNQWRLPTIDELSSILDPTRAAGEAKIDPALFPETRRNVYWSSTLYEPQASIVRVVDFDSGLNYAYGPENPGYVRCVYDTP
ncbi:MAG: DUF1566 domain-containing protein [Leptospirales bacterium]|nr:DUF1566 domain-containing protein [Leptospirales bacterium]